MWNGDPDCNLKCDILIFSLRILQCYALDKYNHGKIYCTEYKIGLLFVIETKLT